MRSQQRVGPEPHRAACCVNGCQAHSALVPVVRARRSVGVKGAAATWAVLRCRLRDAAVPLALVLLPAPFGVHAAPGGAVHLALGYGVRLHPLGGLPPAPASRLGPPPPVGVTWAARRSVPQGLGSAPLTPCSPPGSRPGASGAGVHPVGAAPERGPRNCRADRSDCMPSAGTDATSTACRCVIRVPECQKALCLQGFLGIQESLSPVPVCGIAPCWSPPRRGAFWGAVEVEGAVGVPGRGVSPIHAVRGAERAVQGLSRCESG